MVGWCPYCAKSVSESEVARGAVIKIGRDRYAHTDCIDSHGKENTMNDQTQHILGAADSAHQGIDLAISLLQESLGSMGEILTQGCESLGAASLDSTMRLGQNIKNMCFRLEDLRVDAHGLCLLLGKNLCVRDDEVVILDPGPECPSESGEWHQDVFGYAPHELRAGEDELDDDEQPF